MSDHDDLIAAQILREWRKHPYRNLNERELEAIDTLVDYVMREWYGVDWKMVGE